MAGIKEVAKLANVSPSTVSIIVNGKAKERKISAETQQKVLAAMQALHYQPNLSARKLRGTERKKTIALYWSNDFRGIMLSRFMDGLYQAIHLQNWQYEIIIHPYQNGRLEQEMTWSGCHGAIIANANDQDLAYLAANQPIIPVVLYNRQLPGYGSVYVEDKKIAQMAFEHLHQESNIVLLSAPYAFEGMRIRDQAFLQLNQYKPIFLQAQENNAVNGYQLAQKIDWSSTDAIYAASDMLALGILHYCFENQISIPEQVRLLAIGNGLTHTDEFLNPALSVIEIPMEKMAGQCLQLLSDQLAGQPPIQQAIDPVLIPRQSTKKSLR